MKPQGTFLNRLIALEGMVPDFLTPVQCTSNAPIALSAFPLISAPLATPQRGPAAPHLQTDRPARRSGADAELAQMGVS